MKSIVLTVLLLTGISLTPDRAFAQGALNPTAAPAATMKTLDQIQPRTPISSLPYTISTSGSYYFTTNIIANGPNGLIIQANEVDVDMNGFSLIGTNGTGAGIVVNGSKTNITVRNGIIRSWAGRAFTYTGLRGARLLGVTAMYNAGGLDAGVDALVQDCVVVDNSTGNNGISAADGSHIINCTVKKAYNGIAATGAVVIRDCLVASNNSYGISATGPTLVQNCIATGNVQGGFVLGTRASVIGCIAQETTGGSGISVSADALIRDCQVLSNSTHGISTTLNAVVENCQAVGNGSRGIMVTTGSKVSRCTVHDNADIGIFTTDDCVVSDNQVSSNGTVAGDAGIFINGTRARVQGNNLTANLTTGIRTASGGNFIIGNSARNNTTNYLFTTGDTYGPTNAVTAGSITNLNPYANFSY